MVLHKKWKSSQINNKVYPPAMGKTLTMISLLSEVKEEEINEKSMKIIDNVDSML